VDKNYYKHLANRLVIETDGRNPRSRLTILEILIQGGVTPLSLGLDEFMGALDTVTEWTAKEADAYVAAVAALDPYSEDDPQPTLPSISPEEYHGGYV
jgi:hypothetical protein